MEFLPSGYVHPSVTFLPAVLTRYEKARIDENCAAHANTMAKATTKPKIDDDDEYDDDDDDEEHFV